MYSFIGIHWIGLPLITRHPGASKRGLINSLGADTAQVAVAALSIVKHFDVIEDFFAGQISCQGRLHRPAHYFACEQVHHYSQV